MKMTALICSALLTFAVAPGPVLADEPEILDVEIEKVGMVWNIHVTIEHPDTGWDHYADGWRVHDEEGKELGFRELRHPHVNEQPFTRSLTGVVIPDGTRKVFVSARCSRDGWESTPFEVKLDP